MPLPSTRQDQMDVFHGKAPNIDDNHQIDDISYMQNVVAKTADYSVLVKESGTCFTTTAATGGKKWRMRNGEWRMVTAMLESLGTRSHFSVLPYPFSTTCSATNGLRTSIRHLIKVVTASI